VDVKAFLRYWAPIIVWATLIFAGSTDLMSAEHTSRFIEPFLRWLHPGISPGPLATAQFYIRKAGHVSEYAVLAALFYRALVNTLCAGRAVAAAAIVLLFCAAYAASDEFHQSFVPSRTASARDVAIDVSGALLAVCLYSAFCLGRQVTNRSATVQL
jgi:VanZ family protein